MGERSDVSRAALYWAFADLREQIKSSRKELKRLRKVVETLAERHGLDPGLCFQEEDR